MSYEKHDYADNFLGTNTTVIPLTHYAERLAIAIYIREFDNDKDVLVDVDYNIDAVDSGQIKQVVECFDSLITDVLDRGMSQILNEMKWLSKKQENQIFHSFNGMNAHSISALPLPRLIDLQ